MHVPQNLAHLIAPISEAQFFAEYYGKKPLYVPAAAPDKFADILDWAGFAAMLSQQRIWSPQSLQLFLDGKQIAPAEFFSRPATFEDSVPPVLDFSKLAPFLQRGASLVANNAGSLNAGLRAVAHMLQQQLQGKVLVNIYGSHLSAKGQGHAAFSTHFDVHDVFVLHLAGEKTWHIYERHFADPIAHPFYMTLPPEFHKAHCGALTQNITLRAGDFLYLPRGTYHDALATESHALHATFGLSPFVGLDMLAVLLDRAAQEPAFRAALAQPLPHKPEQLAQQMAYLGDALALFCREPATMQRVQQAMAQFKYAYHDITLPLAAVSYRLLNQHVVVQREAQIAKLTDGKNTATIPLAFADAAEWVLQQNIFSETQFMAAHANISATECHEILKHLAAMGLIALV